MLREEKALLAGGGVLAAIAAAGIFAMVSGGGDDNTVATQPYKPEQAPATQPNETMTRQAQLGRMIDNDRAYTGARGYVLTDATPRGQGQCTEDASIARSGWYGGNTGLLYQAEKGGALYTICLSHNNEAVTGGRVMPLNPAPAPRVEQQQPAKPQVDQALLNRMLTEDSHYLSSKGYYIVGNYEALGNCEDHGARGVFNDNAGWLGGNTGILYTIKDEDNNRYWACASHINGRMQEPIMAAPK